MHYSSSQLPPNSNEERELEDNFLNTGGHIDIDEDVDGADTPQQSITGKRNRRSNGSSCERRPKKWDKMENYIDICSEVMSKKLQRTKEKTIETNANYKEMHTIEECVQIVESMDDIDHNTFNKLMDIKL